MEACSTSSTVSETSDEISLPIDGLLMAVELVDLSVDEMENEVADSIEEVEGSKTFPCEKCTKTYKSQAWLSRHLRTKHGDGVEASATSNTPVITNQSVVEIMKAILTSLKEENLYGEELITSLSSLRSSDKFSADVSVLLNEFCRKKNQDVLLQKFYALIYSNWKQYFPSCDDQKAINLLLIHFPERLVALCKQKSTVTEQAKDLEQLSLSNTEMGPLAYVTGYVLQSLYRKSKTSKQWKSERNQELQTLLLTMKDQQPGGNVYIGELSRGGLWSPTSMIVKIAEFAELVFRNKTKNTEYPNIPIDLLMGEVLNSPLVKSLWDSIVFDVDISKECKTLCLENIIKLYFRVRCFSHARDIINKYKLRQHVKRRKALRTELKESNEK